MDFDFHTYYIVNFSYSLSKNDTYIIIFQPKDVNC